MTLAIADGILTHAMKLTRFKAREIFGPYREKHLVRCRYAVIAAIRERTDWGYNRIGRYMEMDHTTVIYAIRRVEEMADRDADYGALIADLIDAPEVVPFTPGSKLHPEGTSVRKPRKPKKATLPPGCPASWPECPPSLYEDFRNIRHDKKFTAQETRAILEAHMERRAA